MFPEKYELKIEEYPKNEEYKMGGPSWIVQTSNFIVRPEPLSSFKRDSKFRLFGNNLLKKFNIDSNCYTLIYNNEPEWFSYFTLSKLN
tara:strand:+ start:1237 stop:1500 length:264 start_codon:yes stop_codon:yes gene_type:complete